MAKCKTIYAEINAVANRLQAINIFKSVVTKKSREGTCAGRNDLLIFCENRVAASNPTLTSFNCPSVPNLCRDRKAFATQWPG